MNGGSLRQNFTNVMDKLYNIDSNGDGVKGATQAGSRQQALDEAKRQGRTAAQIKNDMTMGVSKAVQTAADMVKNHPVATVAAAGGIAAAAAVCPFLGGLGAAAAGVGMAAKALNGNNDNRYNKP